MRIAEAGGRRREWIDDLVDDGVVVGDDALLGLAEKERDAAFKFARGDAGLGPQPHLGQLAVDLRRGDRAYRHIHNLEARALLQKSNGLRLRLSGLRFPRSDMKMRGDLGAVAVFPRRRHGGRDGKRDPGHVLQQFLHLPPLPGELFAIGEMLVLAAAAASEQRAPRGDAVG